ncbi:MAG: redoxin domain-containing protein [Bacteroidia bacterium]|nr:redoxin domain-containing protein [Bacteroidia bacterium]
MSITIGQAAPNFKLINTQKRITELEQLKGKNVLLLFFPFAFSGTCTKELCSVRDDIGSYNSLNAEVFGISIDSFFVLAKYKEDQKLNFELLSDFNKEVAPLYDSLYTDFILGTKGVTKRSAFLIDKDGIVRYSEILENASEVPNFGAIMKILNQLN